MESLLEKKKTVARTLEYIEAHLKEAVSLDDVAKAVGYSKFHLNRIFADQVGCTIYQYMKGRRLTEAANRLVTTRLPIVEIASEARYESQQAFSLAFKRVYQESPQHYRQKGVFLPRQTRFMLRRAAA